MMCARRVVCSRQWEVPNSPANSAHMKPARSSRSTPACGSTNHNESCDFHRVIHHEARQQQPLHTHLRW